MLSTNPLASSEPPLTLGWGVERRRKWVTTSLSGALGLLIWSQVCSAGVEIELWSASPRLEVLGAYSVPLFWLLGALLLQRSMGAILGFGLLLLPCFFFMNPLDMKAMGALGSTLTLGVSLGLFFVITAQIGERPSRHLKGTARGEEVDQRYWSFPRYVWPRLILLAGIYLVPLWALYSAEGAAQLRENFPDRIRDVTFLIHSLHLFIATIASYLALLAPSVNQAADGFDERERFRFEAHPARRKERAWRVTFYLLGAGALGTIWFVLNRL